MQQYKLRFSRNLKQTIHHQVDPNAQPTRCSSQEQPPAGVQVQDTTGSGGGQIGTGTAPVPGEQGFSANTGETDKHELKANSKQSQKSGTHFSMRWIED